MLHTLPTTLHMCARRRRSRRHGLNQGGQRAWRSARDSGMFEGIAGDEKVEDVTEPKSNSFPFACLLRYAQIEGVIMDEARAAFV